MKRSGFKKAPHGEKSSGFGKTFGKPLRKSKGLRRRSAKKRDEDAAYSILRREFLLANPMCAVFPNMFSTQVHHKKGRGKFYLDVSTWLATSAEGHRFIHDNPGIARRKGWLIYGRDGK